MATITGFYSPNSSLQNLIVFLPTTNLISSLILSLYFSKGSKSNKPRQNTKAKINI